MAFSDEEVAYLRSQPLARLATVNKDGQPDVVLADYAAGVVELEPGWRTRGRALV
jgi:Pyridoxamine 5'-phosphate oxidase